MNEPCRLCGSEPTLATYYDFYVFHCPTPGCPYHLGGWKVANGKGKWYGSIDDAREAWDKRQKRGETPSAPETAEPEPKPTEAGSEPQDGVKHKTKKQLRADAAYRVLDCRYDTTADIVREMVNWGHEPHTGEELRHALIDLLTDDDSGTMETETSQVPEHDTREKRGWSPDTARLMEGLVENSQDTREKLEADIRRAYWCLSEQEIEPVFGWLNRQAAITRRETRQSWQDAPNVLDRTNLQTIAELTAERDSLREKNYNQRRQLSELQDAIHSRNEGELKRQWKQQVEELKAEAKRWADAANGQRLVAMGQADKVQELTAERDELKAEVEAQRKRANDAERGVLSEEWYVSRDRYEDDIAELKAEREKLLAELEAYSDFEKAEFAIPLDKAMEFTTDPPGYVKKHIAKLQAENKLLRGEWESERDYADQCEARAKELAAERDKLQERFLAVYSIKEERDRLKDVVRKQADSFAKMERELHDVKVEAMHSRNGVEKLTEKCQAQREELAKLNAEKRGTKQLPKKVVWPRDEKGKPVKINAVGAKSILFDSRTYLIEYWDGSTRYETYKQAKEAADGAES